MKILAIDTSSEACSASLIVNGHFETLFEIAPQGHSELLLNMCNTLLANAQLPLSQLDGLAFSRGPGSFTGLRIGAGVVQGIAYAQDLPIINISSLQALAHQVARQLSSGFLLAAIDARMGEIYTAEYAINPETGLVSISDEQLNHPEHIQLKNNENFIVVGSGFQLLNSASDITKSQLIFDNKYDKLLVSAEDVAILAANNTDRSRWCSADKCLPVYLRNDVVHKSGNATNNNA